MNYYTSDLHLGHKGILKLQNRPFKDIEEMNQEIVSRWNSKISKNDHVRLLGDISYKFNPNKLKVILDSLNGKITLIKGNHDRDKDLSKISYRFDRILSDEYYFDEELQNWVHIYHYPIVSWRKKHGGSIHLHGHCHGSLKLNLGKAFDVGVDLHNYYPLSSKEVLEIINKKENVDFDHHIE